MILSDIKEEIIVLSYAYRIIFSIFVILIGYIIGSIPFGVLVARSKGVDIMKKGSCSPGYTNVKRVLGFKYGAIVFLLDLLKTFVAIFISLILLSKWSKFGFNDLFNKSIYIYYFAKMTILLTGLGVILGHNYPLFNNFKGGKGITCTLATCLVFNIYFALCLFIIYFLVKKISGYVSLGSIVALCMMFISATVLIAIRQYPFDYENAKMTLPIFLIIALLNIYRHKDNIKRLIKGTENKA